MLQGWFCCFRVLRIYRCFQKIIWFVLSTDEHNKNDIFAFYTYELFEYIEKSKRRRIFIIFQHIRSICEKNTRKIYTRKWKIKSKNNKIISREPWYVPLMAMLIKRTSAFQLKNFQRRRSAGFRSLWCTVHFFKKKFDTLKTFFKSSRYTKYYF